MKKRFLALLLTVLTLVSLCLVPQAASSASQDDITILFTSDLHSHLLPSTNEDGEGEYGGYARLMTLIKEQKALDPNAILVDGGDFSMGSLFQTAYPTSAIELRMMGAMGFDVTTFGNHEYTKPTGFIGNSFKSGRRIASFAKAIPSPSSKPPIAIIAS